MNNWQKRRNHTRNLHVVKTDESSEKWRGSAPRYRFGLFVLGRYIGEVTMLGDNNGHAHTRFLDQVLDKRSEFVTLVPRRAPQAATGVVHASVS